MSVNKPTESPFQPGDQVMINWAFSNGIGGKMATVEYCERAQGACDSGWMVKISSYPNPIDSNWLIKKPENI